MPIRQAAEEDFEALWLIFRAVIATGSTYAFAPETSREDAFAYHVRRSGCASVLNTTLSRSRVFSGANRR
jgi:hypothetical protein